MYRLIYHLHTAGVTGSIPVAPTIKLDRPGKDTWPVFVLFIELLQLTALSNSTLNQPPKNQLHTI
jgi:hypothetical protein